jgi:hypothetical protein
MRLLLATITAAATLVGPVRKVRDQRGVRSLTAQAKLTYGSGGTTIDAYLQTSIDGGITWIDVANFHFTTASATKVLTLNSQTVVASFAPTDGTIAADTVKDGVFGDQWRVKVISVGTYAGGTTLRIDVSPQEIQLSV